jgi:adenine deaminase
MPSLRTFIEGMPKAELHMHLEGSIEPDLMFALAARNGVALRWGSEDELRAAYSFTSLQSFLDVYYAGLTVLVTARDFHDMTRAYLERVHAERVVHAEVFVSPQAHLRRGVAFGAMIDGIDGALRDAERRFGMTTRLIIGFQRHWSEEDAFATLEQALPYRDRIAGIGLGGPEVGNPPAKFQRVFAHARSLGWRAVAHAGEEGPASYVADTVDLLGVDRVDHGVRCEEDPALVARLAARGIPLTVCPVSNVKLRVFADLPAHNLKRLLDAGVCVTVNSDDPSYFGGYMNENFAATQEALGLSRADIHRLARNAFIASFLDDAAKGRRLGEVDDYFATAR